MDAGASSDVLMEVLGQPTFRSGYICNQPDKRKTRQATAEIYAFIRGYIDHFLRDVEKEGDAGAVGSLSGPSL